MPMKVNELKVRLDDETSEKLARLVNESKKNKSEVIRDLIGKGQVDYIVNGKENFQKICQVHSDINAIGHDLNEQCMAVAKLAEENKKSIQQVKSAADNGIVDLCLELVKLNAKKEQIILESFLERWGIEKNNAERRMNEYVNSSCDNKK